MAHPLRQYGGPRERRRPLAAVRREVASRIVEGESELLAYHGRALGETLREHHVPMGELERAVRDAHLASLGDVELAVLEAGGGITIVPRA